MARESTQSTAAPRTSPTQSAAYDGLLGRGSAALPALGAAEVAAWERHLRLGRGLAAKTVACYRRHVERMLADVGHSPAELTTALLEGHLDRLALDAGRPSAATRAQAVAALRSFGGWLARQGITARDPSQGLRSPRVYQRERAIFTRPEIRRLLWGGAADQAPADARELRDRTALVLTYWCGLRVSEIGALEAEDAIWDADRGAYLLRVRHAKAARGDQLLAVETTAGRWLTLYLRLRGEIHPGSPALFPTERSGKGLGASTFRRTLERRIEVVGIERRGRRLTPHSLRHSLATHLLQAGWDVKSVQAHLRHRSITTTERYLRSSLERRAHMLKVANPLDEGPAAGTLQERALAALRELHEQQLGVSRAIRRR